MLRTIDRYVIREVLAPFAIVLLVFTFMLLMDPIMLVADKLIAKGVAWNVVVRVLPTLLPQALALTIPMSLLIGLLVALGRISEDREWVALQACGVSIYRLIRPIALLSVTGWLATSYVLLFALPDANMAYREIVEPVVMSRAESDVKPRVFFQDFPPLVLYVQDVKPDGSWSHVFLWNANQGKPTISLARSGQMVVDREHRVVQMVLHETVQHSGTADQLRVNVSSGDSILSLDPATVFPRQDIAPGNNEMTIAQLRARAADVAKAGFPPVDETMAIQQKFSIPVACLVFGLIAVGLGASSRKDGKMASFVLGIAVIFVYYVLMYASGGGAKAHVVPAWLARWIPNLVLFPVGLALLFWRDRLSDRALRLPSWFDRWRRPADAGTRPAAARGARRVLLKVRMPRFPIPRPRLLDWYISKLYVRLLALTFGGLLVISCIAEFIDLSDKILRGRASAALVVLYFFYKIPYFTYFVIPIAVLIATLVTLGLLTRNSELVVMKACGISLYRAAVPLVIFSLAAGAALFMLEENVLPTTNRRWRTLNLEFRGINTPHADLLNRGWVISHDGNTIYHYQTFSTRKNPDDSIAVADIGDLSTYTFDPASWRLVARSFARRARYSASLSAARGVPMWQEHDGWWRQFTSDNEGTYTAFRERETPLDAPDYLGNEAPEAERMNYFDLKKYVEELKAGGFNVLEPSVRLQQKIAFPFVALVMTLIAVPFAVSMGRRGALYGIGLGVMLAIGYWVSAEVFVAFGKGGVLSPVLAAWAPNILFGGSAAYLLLTVRT